MHLENDNQTTSDKTSISIVGMGYVGLVSAACFSENGHKVIGVDLDKRKINQLKTGMCPIVEKDLPELLAYGVSEGRITATMDLNEAVKETDLTFVCVGTPSREDGSCDIGALQKVSTALGKAIKEKGCYHTIVIRSTIPPGTTEKYLLPLMEEASGLKVGKDFGLAFHPEFLRESCAVADFYQPCKTVVGGFNHESSAIVADLYTGIDDHVIFTTINVAETVKYVDNTWHAVKVSFANEVGKICKASGIDSHAVMDIFVKDTKLNLSPYYLKPGFAYGGSCLPKDVRGINYLARSLGVETPLLSSIDHSNLSQIEYALDLIEAKCKKNIGFLGMTFKAGTDDLRETPILPVISMLIAKGYNVRIYDPNLDVEHAIEHYRQHAKAGQSWETLCIDQLDEIVCSHIDDIAEFSESFVIVHDTAEFHSIIRERHSGQNVIDLVRVFGGPDKKKEIYEVGMDDYLPKPLTKESIQTTLENLKACGKGLNILIAEDNPVTARIAHAMLQKMGHNPTCVPNGREAVYLHTTHNFDVILMDINMPELDGIAATGRIRALPGSKKDIPIVALTSYVAPEESSTYDGICW